MTPTSPLAGLLTGLIDGLIIAVVVLLVVQLAGRRHRAPVVTDPVADDRPAASPDGKLPRAA